MWKTIDNHPNYAISSIGEIVNKTNDYFKSIRIKDGYCFVKLDKKWVSVHRLVALHFIPCEDIKLHVNHKDGNKLNNHYSNLEWCTQLENNRHAINTGLHNPLLTRIRPVYQYTLDGIFIKEWQSGRYAARDLGFNETTISKTALGQNNRKQTGGFRWAFKDRVVPVLCR